MTGVIIMYLNTHDKVLHPFFSERDHVWEDTAEVAENITEDQEEGFSARSEDQISEEVNASCCSEKRIFLKILKFFPEARIRLPGDILYWVCTHPSFHEQNGWAVQLVGKIRWGGSPWSFRSKRSSRCDAGQAEGRRLGKGVLGCQAREGGIEFPKNLIKFDKNKII